ncbi:DNA polymerase III subunit gamma and tau [Corynebacterium sp. LK2536]
MALYRKYRPASFSEVVGQEQVTTPLSAALDSGRINHAYLFSGPRGCGKTSSARIMARSLNCVEGPTSTPCGVCESCVSLAPGGPGNLDVTELDAASHNGVEDMRELRDRAYYAPAESRYRIFIIDEAHMISASGANALLKVVEEPPEHVIFIFATTEPEKIIGTIRSRTHHYPFRLLTPPAMKGLLQRTVAAEGVQVEDSVYPMVIQAGGGSPRDTLSILDQLLAGAGPDGLTYELARPLLGVTDITLIDDAVAALASGDKTALFQLVDHVIEAGHEPRRFAVDLLDRLRDLMVLQAVPDAISAGLVDAPADRAEVLTDQAQRFSGDHLVFLAETVSEQIAGLRGATSPRLLLEILCAHLVSAARPAVGPAAPTTSGQPHPAAQSGQPQQQPQQAQSRPAGSAQEGAAAAAATAARIAAARRERQQQGNAQNRDAQAHGTQAQNFPAPSSQAQGNQDHGSEPTPAQEPAPVHVEKPVPAEHPGEQPAETAAADAQQEQPQQEQAPAAAPVTNGADAEPERLAAEPAEQAENAEQSEQAAESAPEQAQTAAAPVPASDPEELTAAIRNQWATLRERVGATNKVAEIMLTEARVLGIRDNTLVLGHTTGALAQRLNAPENAGDLQRVLREEYQVELGIECVVGTDPVQQGFNAQPGAKPAWDPQKNQRESSDDQESERPSSAAPTPEPQPADNSGWGSPRPLGGPEESGTAPSPQPQPAPPAAPTAQGPGAGAGAGAGGGNAANARPSWQDRIQQAAAQAKKRDANTFSNGVPLPPDPGPEEGYGVPPEDDYVPQQPAGQPAAPQQGQAPRPAPGQGQPGPQDAAALRDEEEQMMAAAAQETGERDHRSALEVAMELLSDQLGARRL